MIAKLRKNVTRVLTGVVVLAVVAGAVYFFLLRDSGNKTVTAQFPAAVGMYPGSPVKIQGVQVGTVTAVDPKAAYVQVTMEYADTYQLPAKAKAIEVANSLVSDRFIQLEVYPSKDTMKSGAVIPPSRTSAPAELDDIYAALNKVSVALGPAGANKGGKKSGALSTLLNVSAANLKGNGAAIGNSITQLSKAARTLADNKGNLFATVRNLQKFTTTLKTSDKDVRAFNDQLAQAASDLAGERGDLGAALHDLGLALDAVNGFVKNNAAKFHSDFEGLTDITNLLTKQKASLAETLAVAPAALANIVHAYYPTDKTGAIATRSNLASLSNLSAASILSQVCTTLGKRTGGLAGLGKTVSSTCKKATSTIGPVIGGGLPTTGLPTTGLPKTSVGSSLPTMPGATNGAAISGTGVVPGAGS